MGTRTLAPERALPLDRPQAFAPARPTGLAHRQRALAGERYLRCHGCGHILGAVVAGHLNVVLRGRELVGDLRFLASIRCEQCGTVCGPPWTDEEAHG
ncbi:MAG: hypothetical protein ACRDI2_12920 [Chloroflexota bacterium]